MRETIEQNANAMISIYYEISEISKANTVGEEKINRIFIGS